MSVHIQLSNSTAVRGLILSAANARLTDREVKSLEHCLLFTAKVWVGMDKAGDFGCAWGLIPPTLFSDTAYLWLYHVDPVVEANKFLFVRNSQRIVEKMLEEYPRITGYCRVNSETSIRWLRWLGASFNEPNGEVVPFVIRKKKLWTH